MRYLIFQWISRQPEGPRDESLDGGNGLPMSLGSRLDQLLSCMGCNRRGSPLSPSSYIIATSRMTSITSPIVRQIPVAFRQLCILLGTRFDQLKLWCVVNRDCLGRWFDLSFLQHYLSKARKLWTVIYNWLVLLAGIRVGLRVHELVLSLSRSPMRYSYDHSLSWLRLYARKYQNFDKGENK